MSSPLKQILSCTNYNTLSHINNYKKKKKNCIIQFIERIARRHIIKMFDGSVTTNRTKFTNPLKHPRVTKGFAKVNMCPENTKKKKKIVFSADSI